MDSPTGPWWVVITSPGSPPNKRVGHLARYSLCTMLVIVHTILSSRYRGWRFLTFPNLEHKWRHHQDPHHYYHLHRYPHLMTDAFVFTAVAVERNGNTKNLSYRSSGAFSFLSHFTDRIRPSWEGIRRDVETMAGLRWDEAHASIGP